MSGRIDSGRASPRPAHRAAKNEHGGPSSARSNVARGQPADRTRARTSTRDGALVFEATPVHEHEPQTESHQARIRDTLALLPDDCESLLEVGCGPGYLLRRAPVARAFGTDLSQRSLEQLSRPGAVATLLDLPFAAGSVDTVLCAETLEHLDPTVLRAAAAELTRVARRYVLVSVPNREQLLASSRRCPHCGTVFHVHGHRTSFDEARLRALFPMARRVEVRGCWRVQPFSPALLWARTTVFDLWKHTRFTVCPSCGNQRFEDQRRRLTYRLFNAANTIVNPRRSQWNWLLLRAELE